LELQEELDVEFETEETPRGVQAFNIKPSL
jgi:cold shock CspA family protein